ncbi:MAG: signal recognition particle protein [Planctomycetes bacterium]|nr:signal recognition particle protein [Planctomycetota bacterium]
MFESLQEGLRGAFKTLSGKARLSESNMRDGLKLVEQALLEADVSVKVAKEFIARVSEEAVGERVLKSLNPSQQLVGIVHRELVNLMGPVDHSLHLRGEVTTLMLCGLQGSGKTTTCGKLGRMIKERGRHPLLVAADLQRPAAIEQLHVLGDQLGIPVYSEPASADPVAVCQNAVKHARQSGADVVILDTAGRLHIDDELMGQLKKIDRRVSPEQVYLVVDGMTGQDAVNSAKAFNEALELDGVIMTKLDGDARGGAALSVKAVTGVPLKFIGVGEHLDALEEFHPERMAGRILGMGDILSLVEKAHEKFDKDEMARAEEQLRRGEFTLDDFRKMMTQMKRLGSMGKLLDMIPGMGQLKQMMGDVDPDAEMKRTYAMIDSMTPIERRQPKVIDQSRRRRIAAGSGVEPHEVNELVKQFDVMAGVMKSMAGKGIGDRLRMVRELQSGGFLNPGAKLAKAKQGTGKRLTAEEKRKLRKQREKDLRKRKRGDRRGENGSG